MDSDAVVLLVLVSSLGIVFLLHAVLCRVFPAASRQKIAVEAALLGYMPVGALLWFTAFDRFSGTGLLNATLYSFVVYSGLAYCYFHFFNMSETARRIKILTVVEQAGSMTDHDLEGLYKTTDVVEARLERLVALGQLRFERGSYSLSGRTLVWAGHIVLFWRRLLGFERDEAGI